MIYIIDFDSTITQVEALDELATLVLKEHPEKVSIQTQIQRITEQAMNGEIGFDAALKNRLALLPMEWKHIDELVILLKTKISDSFLRNKKFLRANAQRIYVVSGGFKEFILPVIEELGLLAHQVYANNFIVNDRHQIIGYDRQNVLSQVKGKVKLIKSLGLKDEIIVIGDGYTDYEIKEAGLAKQFYLFAENVNRPHLVTFADRVLHRLDELIDEQIL